MAEYYRPNSLEQGLALLARQPLQIIAGATDVYPGSANRRAWAQPTPEKLPDDWLDISAIENLHSLEQTDSGWRIGALVTWAEIRDTELPGCFDGLQASAKEVGGAQIQNRATLVGNLCNASPAADGVPPLLCLNATVELSSVSGIRTLALSDFIQGNRKIDRLPNELVTAILVPSQALSAQSAFYKLGARKYLVISIVMAAIVVEVDSTGTIVDCRVAVGSCSLVAQRLPALEAKIKGASVIDDLCAFVTPESVQSLSPITDVRADADYRMHAAQEAIRCLLSTVCHPAGEFA